MTSKRVPRPVRHVVAYRGDLYRAAKGDAEAKREALIVAVREANARGISVIVSAIKSQFTTTAHAVAAKIRHRVPAGC
jgi:hypothetical protein